MRYQNHEAPVFNRTFIYDLGAPEHIIVAYADCNLASLDQWVVVRRQIAEHYGLREDELTVADLYWGGEYHDENEAEIVMHNGEMICSLDKSVSQEELDAIKRGQEAMNR